MDDLLGHRKTHDLGIPCADTYRPAKNSSISPIWGDDWVSTSVKWSWWKTKISLHVYTHMYVYIYIYDAVGPGMPIWMLINVDSFMSHANLT